MGSAARPIKERDSWPIGCSLGEFVGVSHHDYFDESLQAPMIPLRPTVRTRTQTVVPGVRFSFP